MQAHTDMVCEKNEDVKHNFENGVEVYEENGYLMAKGTSLGADNGVGIAYLLAILDSDEVKHPKIEAIFTTQEETTMDGVRNIDASKLSASQVISFDNFSADDIWIGSASSKEWDSNLEMKLLQDTVPFVCYQLDLQNFLGGHSGMDIKDEKRGNPIKIVSELLKDETIFINNIWGGSAINVIPRNCTVIFSTPLANESNLIKALQAKIALQKEKYPVGDIILEKVQNSNLPFDATSSQTLLHFISSFQNGALALDAKQNVVVSGNFATIETFENHINLKYAIRSNKEVIAQKFVSDVQSSIQKYGIQILKYEVWKGYEQSENNELIHICSKCYQEVMKKEPNILGVQACLECEFLNEKIPNLQYIALGTNIYGAHSTKEKVEIASIDTAWEILLKVLETI